MRAHPDDEGLALGTAGGSEVAPLAWPLLWRERVRSRVVASDRHRWIVLWAVLSGLFAAGFSFTILAVALGDIARDLRSAPTSLTWVITGPVLVFALAMPLLGKAGDVYGHRRVYLLGLAGFVVFTALSAVAWNAASLIALRTLAGIEGAACGPTAMALIMTVFDPEDRVKAMGFFSLVVAGAPVIGLVAGGPLIDAIGWRAIFVVQVPLALVALGVGYAVLHETPRQARVKLDVLGAASVAVAATTALLALDRGKAWGFGHPAVLALFAVSPLALGVFVRTERRAEHPLLPLGFLSRRNFTAPIVAQFFCNFAYLGGFIVSPLLARNVFGMSVSAAALLMLWRPLSFSLAAPVAGFAAVRVGERVSAAVGAASIALSMVVMARAAAAHELGLVVVGLVLSGVGMGVASPSLQASVANAVGAEHLGIAGAAQQMVAQMGAAAGIQVLSLVQGGSYRAGPFTHAYLLGGALAAAGTVGAIFVRSLERSPEIEVAPAA